MSQIATAISENLNSTVFRDVPINQHLVSFAALAHDIGHPPFGHSGELVLDGLMEDYGGFEGNAQTLRILCRIEKKETLEFPYKSPFAEPFSNAGDDIRLGLNLTMRSLASVLKYDRAIPATNEESIRKLYKRPVKGYYSSESDIVKSVKSNVGSANSNKRFKTIECSIMDLADDIAYSTYDLEDAFKAGFLSPIEMAATPISVKQEIASEVNEKLREEYPDEKQMAVSDIDDILKETFKRAFESKDSSSETVFDSARHVYLSSKILTKTGYFRTNQTSTMVNNFVQGIELKDNDGHPANWYVKFKLDTFKTVETLKKFSYKSLITSPMLKMTENRSEEIITTIFNTLVEKDNGRRLLPEDWQKVYFGRDDQGWRKRTVCDFIACMTDRYCVEFYSRLTGTNRPSIHIPF